MIITTLIEDTASDCRVHAEHGLSFYIETFDHRLIMDTGASDLTWENAKALGCAVSEADTVVISHGHYDHAGGLMGFAGINTNAQIYMLKSALGSYFHGERYIGIDKRIADLPNLHLIEGADEFVIDRELSLFSNIKGRRLWPKGNLLLSEKKDGKLIQDSFIHEQCLVICQSGKRLLLSGCAHNGILNILDRFESIYHSFPDYVVSGFHMMKSSDHTKDEIEDIEATARELLKLPTMFFTGHCTGRPAFEIMKNIMGDRLHTFSAGDVIEL